jgi:hypothetical protein
MIPGSYSVPYELGFAFSDVPLLESTRYQNGPELHGATDAEYKENGNQFSDSKPSWLVPMIGERDSIMRLGREMISEQ